MALILSGTDGLSDVDGSAATPAIRGTDTNTGMFFPAADTIAFAEGGAEIARFDSSGNLGIGTQSPSAKLDVNGTATANDFVLKTDTSGLLTLGRFSSGYTWSLIRPSSDSSGFEFRSFNGTQWMTLNASGNLGLGVIPSAWSSSSQALQNSDGAIWRFPGSIYFGQNYFFNGTNRIYSSSNLATQYEQRAGEHRFFTAPSGTAGNAITFTQAMTLDASGNLGIGTTSPGHRLDVSGGWIRCNNTTSSSQVQAVNTGGSIVIGRDSSTGGNFGEAYSANLYCNGAYPLRFWTNDAERMRIDSSGNLLVGATSLPGAGPGNAVQGIYLSTPFNGIVSRTTGAADSYECFAGVRNSTTGSVAAWWYNESTLVGRIAITSSATSYITSSDYRLKENIAPMTGALDKVALLKPVTYTWKADGSDGQGFIAHELQEVVPDCVSGEKDAVNEDGSIKPQGIDTSFLVATLTAAIQEQQALINDLTTRLTALENK